MKEMNKRGQSEIGLGTFLLIILGVVGLILVGMFVYNSWSKINDSVATITPEDRTVYAQACEQALNLGEAGYCNDFKEVKIGKEKEYMNCQFLNEQFGLGIDEKAIDCAENIGTNYCTYLKTMEVVKAGVTKKVNNVLCTTSALDEAKKRVTAAEQNVVVKESLMTVAEFESENPKEGITSNEQAKLTQDFEQAIKEYEAALKELDAAKEALAAAEAAQ